MKPKYIVLSVIANLLLTLGPKKVSALVKDKEINDFNENLTLEFVPVKLSKYKKKDTIGFNGKSYLKLKKGDGLIVKDFKIQSSVDENFNLMININEKKSNELNKLTSRYKGESMAMILNGKVLAVPVIKDAINGEHLSVTLKNKEQLNSVLDSIEL